MLEKLPGIFCKHWEVTFWRTYLSCYSAFSWHLEEEVYLCLIPITCQVYAVSVTFLSLHHWDSSCSTTALWPLCWGERDGWCLPQCLCVSGRCLYCHLPVVWCGCTPARGGGEQGAWVHLWTTTGVSLVHHCEALWLSSWRIFPHGTVKCCSSLLSLLSFLFLPFAWLSWACQGDTELYVEVHSLVPTLQCCCGNETTLNYLKCEMIILQESVRQRANKCEMAALPACYCEGIRKICQTINNWEGRL